MNTWSSGFTHSALPGFSPFSPGSAHRLLLKKGFSLLPILIFFFIFKCLSHFEFILCRVWGSVLTSLIYMQLSSFPKTTCWRDCFFSIAYSYLLQWRLTDCRCVGLFLGSLFYTSLHLSMTYMTICAIAILFWQRELCSILWSLGVLHFLVCSFSSGLLW